MGILEELEAKEKAERVSFYHRYKKIYIIIELIVPRDLRGVYLWYLYDI